MGIDGNEIADELGRHGSSYPLTMPEPALGISVKVAREVIRGWTRWETGGVFAVLRGQRQAKGFFKRPYAKRAGELLNLSKTS